MSPARHRLPRARRLKRQRLIRPLFEHDRPDVRQLRAGPLLARYRLADPAEVGREVPLQVGFAVGRALGDRPARNRVKRLMRETFRHHQHDLLDALGGRREVLTLMLIYRGPCSGASRAIARALPEVLARVAAALDTAAPHA